MVEKLSKALEGLKNLQFTTSIDEGNISKKEKMFFCVLAADVMVSLKGQGMQNLPVVIENMINLCDDKDSDVRMVADESLNRVIMSLSQSNMLRVQVELHNVIKKNGPARCLRAALTRFGHLSHFIRPNKGKGHVQMLIPALIEIAKREEESIHETLASSFENIFRVLGVFVQDNALKGLIKAFLHNLSSSNAVIRRCSASCIITVVQYCRKPIVFNCYVLNSLLDCIVPVCEDNSTDLILGVLGCLRILLPTLVCTRNEESISGSFGVRRRQDESLLSVDRLIQVYELCLHYTTSKDHNVVAAALETLNQILENPPIPLETFFLSPAGFSRSYIQPSKESRLWSRSGSEMSVAMSSVDEALLLDDSDITSQFSSFSIGDQFQVQSSSKVESTAPCSDDFKTIKNPFKEKALDKLHSNQTTLDVDSDTESVISELSAPTNFLMRIETEDKEVGDEELDPSGINSQDFLYCPADSDRVVSATAIDVGTFTDTAVPLIFCARHITASFLLDGSPECLKSDRTIRVSIKSLALSCLSAIVKLYPVVMKMNLVKGQTESRVQGMSDVLLYYSHSDPVIRGNVSVLVGSFINSALNESRNFTSDWLSGDDSKLSSKNLIEILLKGLQDTSSVCTRRALTALKLCIARALFSVYNTQFLPLLEYLPALACNSYWLVKVALVEVLSDLPYICISDLTNSKVYQEEVMDGVLLPLLGDEDARVRTAAAEALVRIVPILHNGNSTVSDYGRTLGSCMSDRTTRKKQFCNSQASCHPFFTVSSDPDENIEHSLSIIVAKLTFALLVPESKHHLFGRLEALRLLSEKYPTTEYSRGWNCARTELPYLKSNLIAVVLSLLLTSPFGLDLAAFSNATLLLGNLFAGFFASGLNKNGEILNDDPFADTPSKLWCIFRNEPVSLIAEEALGHLLKVLNFYSRLLEEDTLSSVVEASAPGSLIPLLSPLKKQDKKPEEKAEEKKTKPVRQSVQYAKLQQLLKNAYTNYKVSLDKAAGDKFLDVLESTLFTLSVLLEVATVRETGRCAEEILSYLLSVVLLRPRAAVICVMQLLKSLFGTNLASNWEEEKFSNLSPRGVNLFDVFFHLPTEFLSREIRRSANWNTLECELSKRTSRKVPVKKSDKQWLATYIRLFEPMVVKSLQLYTITGDVVLQSNVLRLLNQLVQLRVNYCMLDGKQIFLDFVLKQFELIEHGQIPGVETLLPCIFRFFILLSYEKQHSKPIMSIPKILQLCDGLMASDQSVQTHCIPALAPVVEDIFFTRSPIPSSPEEKELETQREVLFSMLLRLAEFPEVMDMLAAILIDSRAPRGKDKWTRWSRQVVDSLLPLLSQDRLRIDTAAAQESFTHLMSSVSPNVLRPINPLLKALFVEPEDYNCPTSLKRWLSKVTVLLKTVLFVNEDALLNRLEEISPNVNLTSLLPTGNLVLMDPFNVKSFFQTYKAPETVARFILKVISIVGMKISDSCTSTAHLQQNLSNFFICTYHILKSGIFHRIANALQTVLESEQQSLAKICSTFQNLIHVCPVLTCQLSYFLALLNYCDQSYWAEIVRKPLTLSAKLVQSCAIISLCDHLCDNLSDKDTFRFLLNNCLEELVALSHEIPVKEVFITMHRRPEWALLLEAVSSASFDLAPPRLVEKLLRLLEWTDGPHSGALLKLLLEKFLGSHRLALSVLAASIACRQAEHLLTLPREKAAEQIDRGDFAAALDAFRNNNYVKRHSTLWSLLEKLSIDVFGSSTTSSAACEVTETEDLQSSDLGEEWYFAQVKRICCRQRVVSEEVPLLLLQLSPERISEIMSSADFNLRVLKDCLVNGVFWRKQQLKEESKSGFYEASRSVLWRKVSEICQVLREARKDEDGGRNWAGVLEKLASRKGFEAQFWEICHCLKVYLDVLRKNGLAVDGDRLEEIAEFGILSLKMTEREIMRAELGIHPKNVESGLGCCSAVLRIRQVGNCPSVLANVDECLSAVAFIVSHLVPRCRLSSISREKNLANVGESDRLDFLLEFIGTAKADALLPKYLMSSIREIIVNLCRTAGLSPRVVGVPAGCDMQDIPFLKSFISRFALVGWNTRQQFEEIWVALLSVLGFNTQGDVPPEDNVFLVQASAIAVEGITALLKSTLSDSTGRKLIHHGRDSFSMKRFYEMPPLLSMNAGWEGSREREFLDNLEISERDDRYMNGLVSVEYLWTAVKQITSKIDVYERHCEDLKSVGLDLPSCVHLLTELYNQWVHQASPNIRILTSSLKSSIVMSDLFTDISQFQWLLDFCLSIDEVVIPEDTVILPLIILGCCKAVAIVLPNEEVCERVRKIMVRSKSFPCRLSVVEGLLYLLQSYVVCYSVNHTATPPPGSAFRADEANFVANIVDTFLPVALEVVQEFRDGRDAMTEEWERCHWSLIFYLLQYYQSSLGDLNGQLSNFVVATLGSKSCPASIMGLLVRGIQRLFLTSLSVSGIFFEELERVAFEIIPSQSLAVARNGLQLVIFHSFLDKRNSGVIRLTGHGNAERVEREMERVNFLFEKLKKSYPIVADTIGNVIAYIVDGLDASDVLTKVIQEFLLPHQPHQRIVSSLLFRVFHKAEQSLLEDWVVFTLPSFVQGLPVSMSVWTLNCFFVSASSQPWLRYLFPHVEVRERMAEAEDKNLLCLSGARFYRQLKHDAQKKSFAQTFEKAKGIDKVFQDLLSAIS